MNVRLAQHGEAKAVQEVFKKHAKMVGFVMEAQIEERIRQGDCLVAVDDNGTIIAAVNFHKTRKGYTTIYEIASNVAGGGSALVREMQSWKVDIKLKTTADNVVGIHFYRKMGFKHIVTEPGKKRELLVFYWVSPRKSLF